MEDRLQKFVRLVDAGNFVKAAQELRISQPALSVAIAKLERELRAALLVRGVRPLTVTPAGQLAYAAGKDIALRKSNLKTLLAELAEQKVPVSVGTIDSVASALLASPDSVDDLERNASVSLVVDNSRNLVSAIDNGTLDLAFVVGRRFYGKTIEVLHTATETLLVVCAPEQLADSNAQAAAGRLRRFISYDQSSTTRQLVLDALLEKEIEVESMFYSTSPEVMLGLVRQQRGVAALPYQMVQPYIAQGDLAVVGRPTPLAVERPIHVIQRQGTILASPLQRTVSQAEALLAPLKAGTYGL